MANFPYFTNLTAKSDGGKFAGKMGGQAGSLLEGASIGAANAQLPSEYEINPYAGLQSGAQAFMSTGNPYAAAVAATVGQVGQFAALNKNLKNTNASIQGMSYDAYGNPVYQGAQINQAQDQLKALQSGEKKMSRSFDPTTQIFSRVFGTKRRYRKAQDRINQSITNAQNQYNTASVASQGQQNQMEDYYQRLNNNRFMNLYQ